MFRRNDAAHVVSFGGGVDSTAILCGLNELAERGDDRARPDLILFADTGGELPETYDHIALTSAWCVDRGLPPVTTVSRKLTVRTVAPYDTLEGNCLDNETLPSEAFGMGSCSIKWKQDPMSRYLSGYKRAPATPGWLRENGWPSKAVRIIGYDAGEAKCGKRGKWAKIPETDEAYYRYPLVEWGWGREYCRLVIERNGLPVPPKSACFFCPNQTEEELRTMAVDNPDLLRRAIAMEDGAIAGKHQLREIEGLWRRTRKRDNRPGRWAAWVQQEGLL